MISTPKPRLSLFKLYESPEFGIGGSLLLLLFLFFRLDLDIGKEFVGREKCLKYARIFKFEDERRTKICYYFRGEGKIGSRILFP